MCITALLSKIKIKKSASINSILSNKKSGQSLVELLVIIGLCTIILPAILTGVMASREGKSQQIQSEKAINLLKEEQEALRNIRESGWSNISTDGTYHAVISGSNWILQSGIETTSDNFQRKIDIGSVYRDITGTIVSSGGTLDPSSKIITITVSWNLPYPYSLHSTTYLTRYLDNLSWTQTTYSDFNAGTKTNTYISNTQGGEVILGAGGGGGDWCIPNLSVTSVNLSRQGIPTAISASQGVVLTGTGLNSSGPTFAKTTITGNNPPVANVVGVYENSKANGLYGDTNYAYIATTNHSQEITILDLNQYSDPPTNSKYKAVGYFDAPGNGAGNSVYVSGNVGYMTSDNMFYIFDLSSKTGSRPSLYKDSNGNTKGIQLAGTGNKIIVTNNYAFVAVSSTTSQLQVINVTDPANPSIVAQVNVGNNQPGIDVATNTTGTRAYLVTNLASPSKDFFIIDTTNKSGNLLTIGTGYDTNGMTPKGIAVATGNKAIIVGTGGSVQYLVLSISDETKPIVCGTGLQISGGAFAVSTVLQSDGYAYSYVVTGDTNAELKIILGGAGGQYTSSGTFESSTLDILNFTGSNITAFNRFIANVSNPAQTDIKLQISVAAPNPSTGNCSGVTFTYLGPNGDPGQYFTVSSNPTVIQGSIPYITYGSYTNPGRCFRYKAYFSTTDSTATPELYDFTVNFSP